LLQQEAMECLRAARHNNYVSEFHIAFQAVAYAVSGSRLVVDMLGHLGPGGSYKLLKDWLVGLGGEPLSVPQGLILVAFDNEQRLLRNYLSRGNNRSRLDILTNVCCAVLNKDNTLQQKENLHPRNWTYPSASQVVANCVVTDVLSQKKFCELLFPYINSRIGALTAAGPNDEVEGLIKTLSNEKNFIQCPGCGQLYDKKKRNCNNEDCHVKNVRQAIAEASGVSRVSTEHQRVTRSNKRHVRVFEYGPEVTQGSQEKSLQLKVVQKVSESETVPSVQKAEVHMMEPCFVNPNSHQAVTVLLRQIGESSRVVQCGGKEREWLAIECDGAPYLLARTVIDRSRLAVNAEAKKAAGICDARAMTVSELRDELSSRGLARTGTSQELKDRLGQAVRADIESGKLVPPAPLDGEFDWVVLRSGALHWEMKLVQCAVDVLWSFTYQKFSETRGYTTERQQEWAKSCKDHHRSFDELSRFTDGSIDELLYPYVHSVNDPSPAGFFTWAEQYRGNHTFTLLLQLVVRCCFGVMVYRHGLRHNVIETRLLGRRCLTPLIHARNFPNYQLIDVWDESDLLAYPEEIASVFNIHSSLSRSGRGDAHQSLEAIIEELNQQIKTWLTGDEDSDLWRRIIRNLEKLQSLRRQVFLRLDLADPISHARTRPRYTAEVQQWRAALRPFLTGGTLPLKERPLQSMSGELYILIFFCNQNKCVCMCLPS